MSQPLLKVEQLSKRFGGFVVLDQVDLYVNEGERLGLIGPNGSGKSTLVNCLSGVLTHDSGRISLIKNHFKDWPHISAPIVDSPEVFKFQGLLWA